MTTKGRKRPVLSKRVTELTLRFREAYRNFNEDQRAWAQAEFLRVHNISYGTFRNKMSGWATVFEAEVKWMERFDPYEKPAVTPN